MMRLYSGKTGPEGQRRFSKFSLDHLSGPRVKPSNYKYYLVSWARGPEKIQLLHIETINENAKHIREKYGNPLALWPSGPSPINTLIIKGNISQQLGPEIGPDVDHQVVLWTTN